MSHNRSVPPSPFSALVERISSEVSGFADALALERAIAQSCQRLRLHLRERRKVLKLDQVEIARRMGVSQSAVSKIETGEGDVSLFALFRYGEALGLKVDIELRDFDDSSEARLEQAVEPVPDVRSTGASPHSKELIFVVDDNDDVRDCLRMLLESAYFQVRDYPSAKAFLADDPSIGQCLITDIRMPEMDGLELQEEVVRRQTGLPVLIITGHGDVPLAVRAMKAGAIDFIEKPFDDERLLASVRRALEIGNKTQTLAVEAAAAGQLLALLTPRERSVLGQLVVGRSNKVAAYELGITPRTVELHRSRVMEKMNANSLSELVRRFALMSDLLQRN